MILYVPVRKKVSFMHTNWHPVGCFFWLRENGQEFSLMSGERSFLKLFRDSQTPLDSIRDKLVTLIYFVIVQCLGRHGTVRVKIYCNNFNSSNAVVCSHLILAYTVRLAIINAVELERNGWFFFWFFFNLYWGMLCCDWKEHRQKSLQIELVTKYDTKDA